MYVVSQGLFLIIYLDHICPELHAFRLTKKLRDISFFVVHGSTLSHWMYIGIGKMYSAHEKRVDFEIFYILDHNFLLQWFWVLKLDT